MAADIKKIVDDNYEFLVNTRRHFHMYPELSSCEYETAAYIKKALDEWNIPYETTGVSDIVATIQGNGEGKTIALRGDIDALPIQEETGVEWASKKPGIMHACGHDCHATYMLGCAKILNEIRSEFNGTVKIIFQEGEEIGAGARKLMETNLLDDVERIIGLHVSNSLDLGKFSIGYGVMSSYGAGARIVIESKGGSLDKPEITGNSILAATEIVSGITSQSAHLFPGEEQVVLVPTVIVTQQDKDGIPNRVILSYNFRTFGISNVEILKNIVDTVASNTAKTFGTTATVEHWGPGEAVNNEKESTDLAAYIIGKYFGKDAIIYSKPSMGGEDFSLYQKKIPGTFVHIGGAVNGVYHAEHTDKTLVDDGVLALGVEFFIRYVIAYFRGEAETFE